MGESIKGKIQIETYEDIIRGEEDSIFEVDLKELHPFKNHPFKVLDDDNMKALVESVKKDRVIEPGLVMRSFQVIEENVPVNWPD